MLGQQGFTRTFFTSEHNTCGTRTILKGVEDTIAKSQRITVQLRWHGKVVDLFQEITVIVNLEHICTHGQVLGDWYITLASNSDVIALLDIKRHVIPCGQLLHYHRV